MNRISIIQSLIDKNNYTNYLEIGVQNGSCFSAIVCENKTGVDPDPNSAATIFETSDDFFAKNKEMFDIFFVDGLHVSDQVERDVLNCLKFMSPGGTIVMHDCLPTDKFMQLVPHTTQSEWVGDTWRAFYKLHRERSDLSMATVDADWGCGIIQVGSQIPLDAPENPTYEEFCIHKHRWMNIISVEGFKQLYL